MSERDRNRGKERWKQEKRKRKKRRKNRQQLEKQQNVSRRKKREVAAWERLDNTANLFPAIATQNMTNVYRISAKDCFGIILRQIIRHRHWWN